MTVLSSALDPTSAEYAEYRAGMLGKLAELDAEHGKALAGVVRSMWSGIGSGEADRP